MSKVFIGDEHCRGKFIQIYNQIKDDASIDFIGCAGDYFSPYVHYDWAVQEKNFLDIIQAARDDSRIKLLLGNHDLMYLHPGRGKSRYDHINNWRIRELILDNIELFNIAVELPELEAVFSHAGISQEWLDLYEHRTGHKLENIQELNSTLHRLKLDEKTLYTYYDEDEDYDKPPVSHQVEIWKADPDIQEQLRNLYQFSDAYWDTYGEAKDNSPVWIRPNGLRDSFPDNWKLQIVGHTKCYRDTLAFELGLTRSVYGPEACKPLEIWVDDIGDKKIRMIDTDDALTYWRID